jgi:DNA-binding response OmpR family regulator
MRVLLVEDDLSIARSLDTALSHEGFTVDAVATGEAALFLVSRTSVDVVILDIGLPDMDGLSVLKKIREHDKSLPVLLLTARDRIEDKVEGLDRGADDYLTKPFELPELVARLRVVSRRLSARADSRIQVNGVTLDPAANTISVGDRRIDVSGKEYSVLLTLMENKGRLLSREKMEAKLYAWGEELSSNAVEVHIHNLRKKLGKDFIKTVRGVGYGVGLE